MATAMGWFAVITSPTVAYSSEVPPLVLAGVGMSLYFAPLANLVLSTVRRKEEGKASGVNNTVREVGECWASQCWQPYSRGSAATRVHSFSSTDCESPSGSVPPRLARSPSRDHHPASAGRGGGLGLASRAAIRAAGAERCRRSRRRGCDPSTGWWPVSGADGERVAGFHFDHRSKLSSSLRSRTLRTLMEVGSLRDRKVRQPQEVR